MVEEKKDFKEVKVKVSGGAKEFSDTLSRSMVFSGVNIFGQLTQIYLNNKEDFQMMSIQNNQSSGASSNHGGASGGFGGASASVNSSMVELSSTVTSIFKKIQKRDPITKIKALSELGEYLKSVGNDAEELPNLLTFFLYHFCRILLNEPDKKVREAAHNAFTVFIKKGKRRLASHIKKIFPTWLCSFFDSSPEVARIAKANFDLSFPEDKQDQVFKLAYKNFLHFAGDQLQQSEESMGESSDQNKQQRQEIYDSITSQVIQSLAYSFKFISSWDEQDKLQYQKKLVEILDIQAPKTTSKIKGKPEPISFIWSFLKESNRARVKAACLQFVCSFATNVDSEHVESQIKTVAPLVLGMIGDKNSIVQTTLWREAIFTLGKQYPSCWSTISIKKTLLPKLNTCLKEAAFGAPMALYENFVKYASVCPLYQLTDIKDDDKLNKASLKERANLIREMLSALYQGLRNEESVTFHRELVHSYFETLTFILIKRVEPLSSKPDSAQDLEFVMTQILKSFELPVEDYILTFVKNKSKAIIQRNLKTSIPERMVQMLQDLANRQFNVDLYGQLVDKLVQVMSTNNDNHNTSKLYKKLMLKIKARQIPTQYSQIIQDKIYNKLVLELYNQIENGQKELNKQTVVEYTNKCKAMQDLLYIEDKLGLHTMRQQLQPSVKFSNLFQQLVKQEIMASKVLGKEDLDRFQQIKKCYITMTILVSNIPIDSISPSSNLPSLFSFCLSPSNKVPFSLYSLLLLPSSSLAKSEFSFYMRNLRLNSDTMECLMGFVKDVCMVDENLNQHQGIVQQGVQWFVSGKESYFDRGFVDLVQGIVYQKVQDTTLDLQLASYNYSIVQDILVDSDGTQEQFDVQQADMLRQALFKTLLYSNQAQYGSRESYTQDIWAIFNKVMANQIKNNKEQLQNYGIVELQKKFAEVIMSDFNLDVDKINHLTNVVKQFVQQTTDKSLVVQKILLKQENFSNLENNSLPLKMFKDLFLSGGIGFDVSSLFIGDQSKQYAWLAGTLLNTLHLSSLSSFVSLKKQFSIFVETEILPVIINQGQEGNIEFIVDLAQFLAQEATQNKRSSPLYTLDYLLQKLIDPGEDYPVDMKPVIKIDNFREIFDKIGSEQAQYLVDNECKVAEQDQAKFSILSKLLRKLTYFIMDEPVIGKLFKLAQSQVWSSDADFKGEQFQNSFDIYVALQEFFETEDTKQEKQFQLVKNLLSKNSDLYDNLAVLTCTLEFSSKVINTHGVTLFTQNIANQGYEEFINKVTSMANTDKTESDRILPVTYQSLLSLIRKTLPTDLIQNKQQIISNIIRLASVKANQYVGKLNTLASADVQKKEQTSMIQEFEFEMLQEFAETLLTCTSYVNSSLNQEDLYALIGSGIDNLQKAAFVVLRFFYQNYIPDLKHASNEDLQIQEIKALAIQQAAHQDDESDEEVKEERDYSAQHQDEVANNKALQNIPASLLQILDNAPSINQQDEDDDQVIATKSNKQTQQQQQLDKLIFGENKEGCVSKKAFGYLLAWNGLLCQMEYGRTKAALEQKNDYNSVLSALTEYLEQNQEVYQMLLVVTIAFLPHVKKNLQSSCNLSDFAPEYMDLNHAPDSKLLSLYTLVAFMKCFPSLGRKFYRECDNNLIDIVIPYIKQVVSPAILENEIKKIEMAQVDLSKQQGEGLSFALYKSTAEILGTYTRDEVSMQLKLKIPQDYPLQSVQVDIGRQLKLKDQELRKWSLSIRNLLQARNGDIISAILLWKNNIDKEMDGVEDCMICMQILQVVDKSLPKMECKTCKMKFHVACIRKWFKTSNKSNCPHCQTFFFQ